MKRALILALAFCLLAVPLGATAEFAFVQLGAELYADEAETAPLTSYPAGTWLEIVDDDLEGALILVVGSDGRTGYVSQDDVFTESMMNTQQMAVVNNNGKYVNLRAEASKNSAVLAKVNTGTPIALYSSGNSYDNVMVGGITGYMLSSMVMKYGQPIFSAYAVSGNGKSINMRDEPTMNGNVLHALPSGTRISVYLMGGGWSRIGYQNAVGYMMTKFIKGSVPGPVPTYVPRPHPTVAPTFGPIPDDFTPVNETMYVSNGDSYVRYRVGPGTEYATAGRCYSGDEVYVYATNGPWCRIGIGYGGDQYYMMSQYLVYVEPIEPDPDPYDPYGPYDPDPEPEPFDPDYPVVYDESAQDETESLLDKQ